MKIEIGIDECGIGGTSIRENKKYRNKFCFLIIWQFNLIYFEKESCVIRWEKYRKRTGINCRLERLNRWSAVLDKKDTEIYKQLVSKLNISQRDLVFQRMFEADK